MHTPGNNPAPLISVVIPSRNEELYLPTALESVAEQDYPIDRIECVVVVNGSVDDTHGVAVKFANDNPQLKVNVLESTAAGVSEAKNHGAGVATGQAMIFMDADSRMERGLARHVAAYLRAGFRAASIRVVADSDDLLERAFFQLSELGKLLLSIRAQMMYCQSDLFAEIGGFRSGLQIAEDLEFLTRAQMHLRHNGQHPIPHIRSSRIYTSTRRLRKLPFRLSLVTTLARWALAYIGVWRERIY